MKSFSVKSKFVMILALVLALFGGALLLFFGQNQKTVIKDTVAVDGPTNQEGFWTDDGRRASGFSGGTGYEDSPYQISSAEELAFLAYQVNEMGQTYAGRYFILTNNIDLSEYYWQPIGMQYDRLGTAINRPFAGNFDGATYYIEGLYTPAVPDGVTDTTALRGYNNQGLFGYVYGHPITIKNITIQNSFIQGYQNVGAVVGSFGTSYNSSTSIEDYLEDCIIAADVNVYGQSYIGGLAGFLNYRVSVDNCVNNGQITANGNVGGVIGGSSNSNFYSEISNCVNNGTITMNGNGYIGGIAGGSRGSSSSYFSNFFNCTNNGSIVVNNTAAGDIYVGGLAGSGRVSSSVNTSMGTITVANSSSSRTYVGGIVAYASSTSENVAEDCNNQATIGVNHTSTEAYVGGVAGYGNVLSCYNIGNITNSMGYTGGVCGAGDSLNSYNSGSLTGGTYIGGISNSRLSNSSYITVANSYNSGALFANENTQYVGGVVGAIRGDNNGNMSQTRNSFNIGSIDAKNATAGGIIGVLDSVYTYYSDRNYVMAVNSFNVGQINAAVAYGVVGASNVEVSAPEISIEFIYYNNTDAQSRPLEAFPVTSTIQGGGTFLASLATQAKTEGFFTNTENWSILNRWEFVVTWAINPDVNDGYPSFNQGSVIYWTDDAVRANSFGGGSGTQEDPYLISNAEQLAYLAYMVNSGQGPYVESVEVSQGVYLKHFYQGVYFQQTQLIDLSEHVWPGIGVYDMSAMNFFAGNYNGAGFEITGMYAVGQMSSGLFGMVGNDPMPLIAPGTPGHEEQTSITIENIVLVNPVVAASTSSESYVGGLIGAAIYCYNLTVSNCSIQNGFMGANSEAGGIIGFLATVGQTSIVNCSNSATVIGGGIIGVATKEGDAQVLIMNCVNSGEVYGAGIVMDATACQIINCVNNGLIQGQSSYAAGIVGNLNSSSIMGSVNNGQISGDATYAGGIVGQLASSQILNAYNIGTINVSSQYTGGLAGYVDYGSTSSISRSYNAGAVTNLNNSSAASYTAGILAYSQTINVSNSYNKANITSLSEHANSYTAGIIGTSANSTSYGRFKNLYNTGDITASSNVGGIIGNTRNSTYNYSDVDNAFNTGNVIYIGSSDSVYIGGVAANAVNATDVANAYYGGACPSSVPAFGSGSGTNVSYLDNLDSLAKTEEWFSTETNWDSTSLWDFANTWAVTEGENDGYPVLIELDWWINSENVASSFAGGSGTQDDPYLIETPAQLAYLSYSVYYGLAPSQMGLYYYGYYFKQTANIDLSGHLWFPISASYGIYGEESGRFFAGNYDGSNFTISGVATQSNSDGVGLFGVLAPVGQTIENVVIENSSISGISLVGGIVGCIQSLSLDTEETLNLINCVNKSNIQGQASVGGIVGGEDTRSTTAITITNCSNQGDISGGQNVGGIIGYSASSDLPVVRAENYGYVDGDDYVGGIVGRAGSSISGGSSIIDSSNHAAITGSNNNIGGISGYGGQISKCFNNSSVEGSNYIGGIVGRGGSLFDCYTTSESAVIGFENIGGIVGGDAINLVRTYSQGIIEGENNVGGIIGCLDNAVSGTTTIVINNFALASINGVANTGAIAGSITLGSSNLTTSSNYYGGEISSDLPGSGSGSVSAEYLEGLEDLALEQVFFEDYETWDSLYMWDFAKVWSFESGENSGYPVFSDVQTWIDAGIRGTSFGGGSGTQQDPYIISSAQELAYLSYMIYTSQAPYTTETVSIFSLPFFYQNTYFKQTADIDLSAYYWSPIGASLNATATAIGNIFAGHYDGGGYTISGIKTLNGPSLEYANQALFGLFGSANYPASISNVTLKNTDISGRMTVSSLVGSAINSNSDNVAAISNCHHNGNLYLGDYQSTNYVGGIVGNSFVNTANLVVENCSSAGNINVANEDSSSAGGVVGNWTGDLSVTNVQSYATITGGANVGGFAGALNLSDSKVFTLENALITGVLSGVNVGGFAGSIATSTTSSSVTVSHVGYEVDIISATTAGVIASSISGSNLSFANSYAIIDASQTSVSQFTTQAEGMTQDSSLYYVATASGENRYYAGDDFSDFVWVDGSPCPIMADFVWMGEELLQMYYQTYGEGYMTNLITSSGSGWQAIS